jgi:hypothetical protein
MLMAGTDKPHEIGAANRIQLASFMREDHSDFVRICDISRPHWQL